MSRGSDGEDRLSFEDELPAPGRYEIGSIAMANTGLALMEANSSS